MKRLVAIVFIAIAVSAIAQPCGPPLPVPKIAFLNKVNEPGFTRYWFTVSNRAVFNNVFFTPSPNLPPCGLNNNSARTWLTIYNGDTNAYIYGYCALPNNAAMAKLWFAVPTGTHPPKRFYIKLEDRLCHVTKQSNTVVIP